MEEKFLYYNFLPLLADHIIDFPRNRYPKEINPRHNYPVFLPQNVKNGDVIFVKSNMLGLFFFKGLPLINAKFYLITGVAGMDINKSYEIYVHNEKIIKWVGCNVLFTHPKIMKIPIGFEEVERSVNGPAAGEGGDQKLLEHLYKNKIDFDNKKNRLLVTHIGNTHNSRNNLINGLRNKNFIDFAKKMKFEHYMKTINNYKFVLCPRGSGTDTHRFWEVILVGSVPILESSGLDDLYNQFPCIIIDSYDNLKEKQLNNYKMDNNKLKNVEKYLFLKNFKIEINKFIQK